MNVSELFYQNGESARVWACGKCRTLHDHDGQPVGDGHGRSYTAAERDEFGRLAAVRCCDWRCEVCGEKNRDYHSLCDTHDREERAKREREREAARYEKAKKLTPDEWGQSDAGGCMVYDAIADQWHANLGDADEWYADDEERVRPAYLWCSEPVRWSPTVSEDIADAVDDNFGSDASDAISHDERQRLDAFVEEWWKGVGVRGFEPDFSRCVLLPVVPADHADHYDHEFGGMG